MELGDYMFYICILIINIILTWKFADWKNWKLYHSTMLFYPLGNLLYCFVYHDKFLWKFRPDILNHHIMEIIYSFSVYPLVVLLFLSCFPKGYKKQLIHIAKYIFIFILIEFILFKMGRFEYDYGWNIWWSLAWNGMAFPLMILHHKKPLIAYSISAVIIFLMNWIFPFKLT